MKTIIAAILLVLLSSLNSAWCAEKELDKILNEYVQDVIKLNPEEGQSLGINKKMGSDVDYGKLTIRNPDFITKMLDLKYQYYDRVKKVSDVGLSDSEKLDKEIFLSAFHGKDIENKFKYHNYEISQMLGDHSSLIKNVTDDHPIKSEADIKDLISKLKQIKFRFSELRKIMNIQEELKIIPSKYVISIVLKQIYAIVKPKGKENVVYIATNEKIDKLSLSDSVKSKYNQEILDLIKNEIFPAYFDYHEYLRKLYDKADTLIGVWQLPNGDEFYKYCLQTRAGTDLSPDQVHELGLKEVDRIHKQMIDIFKKHDVKGNSFAEMYRNFYAEIFKDTTNANFFYEFSEKGKEDALADYQKIIDETNELILPKYFKVIPKTPVVVKRLPLYLQGGPGAGYFPAPLDGSGEGVFYADLSRGTPLKNNMYSLTYHEAIPGHHLQMALARESADIKMFKNFLYFTEFVEGWALYVEILAGEENWFKNDYARLDNLTNQLNRAVRLVLDTGIHAKKWTIEEAFNYQKVNQGGGSFGDIIRYSVWPGQACSYMIGALKIRELREKAKVELGSKFDIKEFHHAVLKNGELPLNLLEKQIDKYIAENK